MHKIDARRRDEDSEARAEYAEIVRPSNERIRAAVREVARLRAEYLGEPERPTLGESEREPSSASPSPAAGVYVTSHSNDMN